MKLRRQRGERKNKICLLRKKKKHAHILLSFSSHLLILLLYVSHTLLHTVTKAHTHSYTHTHTHTHELLRVFKRGQNRTEGRPHSDMLPVIGALSYWWSWKKLRIRVKGLRVQFPLKRGQWRCRDKVKALKAAQTQRSGGSTLNKRAKTETHVRVTPLEGSEQG